MPTDEALIQQAEDWKARGNAAYARGSLADAVSAYSQGVVACDRCAATTCPPPHHRLKAALLSNRAACHLKGGNCAACVEDCATALRLDPEAGVRSKLLYRRAKARFLLGSCADGGGGGGGGGSPHQQRDEQLQEAARDLLQLLSVDPRNREATELLSTIRALHRSIAPAVTPVGRTLDSLRKDEDALHHVKILLGVLDDDVSNASMELGRLNGIDLLLQIAAEHASEKVAVLAINCISQAGGHPLFVRQHLAKHQRDLLALMEQLRGPGSNSDLVVSLLAALVRVILHADRDDPDGDVVGTTVLDYDCIVNTCSAALQHAAAAVHEPSSKTVLRAVLDVLSTWTCGTDREAQIRSSLHGATDPALPAPRTQAEIRAFTPQELAAHRRRQADKRNRDAAWAFERSLLLAETGGLKKLVRAGCQCRDHVVRREITVAVGRMLAAIEDDDKIKAAVRPFLGGEEEKRNGPVVEEVVEEVYNEDGEEKEEMEEEEVVPLEIKMERALITCALLLSKKEVGAWALGTGWRDSSFELPDLIHSGDARAMCLASEVVSGAATVEQARGIVTSLVNSGAMKELILSDDRDIRSGAASAVAKLGLAEKSTDEGEVMGMLQGACDLLEDQGDDTVLAVAESSKKKELHHFSSFATSSVERGIEMITYLIPNTTVKEELAAGFSSRVDAPHTALDLLVKTADLPNAGESLSGYGLATIFQNMAATNEQVRKEAFEGKDVTMEQYDEMQRLGKTDEEKERMDAEKDPDTIASCHERIRKMASANVPRALVSLMEGASEHTMEQLVLGMNRMAQEESVRGIMIQQGVLSACIKVEKNEGPTETDVMKKVIRLARHCIAKMLVTTNPSLLTSAQRLGSARPLIQLIRDIKASDLQHFEALLAITNIASSGDDAKNRIVTEKGIPTFHFAMFSDHEMVRRAATEAMCNLVPHQAMMDHLAEGDHVKLWLAFASDYEENYECARAAAGCLAMATQDETIALKVAELSKFKDEASLILESGRPELMHRGLVLILNLVEHGSETREKVVEAGLVAFCRAYVESIESQGADKLQLPPEELQILPITVEIAKKIVQTAG